MSQTNDTVTSGASRSGQDILVTESIDIASLRIRPRYGRIFATAVSIVLALVVLMWLVGNDRFGWDTVAQYLFAPRVLEGLWMTAWLTVVIQLCGSLIGALVATLRLGTWRPGIVFAQGYIWVVRAVPPLLQLIFWYNLAYLIPTIAVGVPFGPQWFELDTNKVISPVFAGILGLAVYQGAYMAEIFRGGVLAVGSGQRDAARAVGLGPFTVLRRVVVPQAMRVVIPAWVNMAIMLVHGTALLSAISVGELLHSVQGIYVVNFEVIPLLLVATIWYLVITAVLSIVQRFAENHFNRGITR